MLVDGRRVERDRGALHPFGEAGRLEQVAQLVERGFQTP